MAHVTFVHHNGGKAGKQASLATIARRLIAPIPRGLMARLIGLWGVTEIRKMGYGEKGTEGSGDAGLATLTHQQQVDHEYGQRRSSAAL